MERTCTLDEKYLSEHTMEPIKDREHWTKEETQKLIDLAKSGLTAKQIGAEMNRSYSSIASRAGRISLTYRGNKRNLIADVSSQNDRPCLLCEWPMISTGRGHRICDQCKDSQEWRSGP